MNNPLKHLERITASAEPLTANQHPTFQTLMECGLITVHPDLIVARRRRLQADLGAEVLKVITLERVGAEGAAVLEEFDDDPTLGRIDVRIEGAPTTRHGPNVDRHFASLSVELDKSGTTSATVSGTMPMDVPLVVHTRNEWSAWGFRMDYVNTEWGGHFSVTSPANVSQELSAVLSRIA